MESLYKEENEWPQLPYALNEVSSDDPEVKQTVVAATSSVEPDLITSQMITRFSSWNKLLRTAVWILRYKEKLPMKLSEN